MTGPETPEEIAELGDGVAMRVEIHTSDAQWAAVRGSPGAGGRTVITVTDTEFVMFAGKAMVRGRLPGKLPRDYPNPWVMVPAEWAS